MRIILSLLKKTLLKFSTFILDSTTSKFLKLILTMKRISYIPFLLLTLFFSCQTTEKADLIVTNAAIYTVDQSKPSAQAVAIKDDRILALGTIEEINLYQGEATQIIDAKGQFVMPGLIEGHAHFTNMGKAALILNFLKSKSWEEIVAMVAEKAKNLPAGEWIEGRGWHQEKWMETPFQNIHGYPFHDELSAVSPNNPVILYHASGHSLFANAKAMELADITPETPNPAGGEIVRDAGGKAIGVFEERAMTGIKEAYQSYLETIPEEEQYDKWLEGIRLAEQECLSYGITSFQDAGSTFQQIKWYNELAKKGELNIRLWAMIRHSFDEMKGKLTDFPIMNAGNHHFTVNAIKSEVDGALGAFGAWLLRPYSDKPDFEGQNTTPISEVKNIAQLAYDNKMQFCVHAIGDRANRIVLNIYEEQFQKDSTQKDLRWRIEHAQHLNPEDIPRFKDLEVIASMQGIHCTSDAPFVEKRLGVERSRKGAYPWRSLLDVGVIIANGTDAPVESVNPFESLYASVTRQRIDNGMKFFPEQSMSREEALYSYTLGNAYAAFEEKDKGSLSVGKLADLIVLSNNLLTCPAENIYKTDVLYTILGGKVVYQKED